MDFSAADGLLQYQASADTETGLILKLRPAPVLPLKGLGWNFQVCEQWPQTFYLSWTLRQHSGITLSDHCVNQSNESRMNDCIGILYSDSEFMDLSGSLILAPLQQCPDTKLIQCRDTAY